MQKLKILNILNQLKRKKMKRYIHLECCMANVVRQG